MVPELIEQTAGGVTEHFVTKDHIECGLWVGTLHEGKADPLICILSSKPVKLLLTISAASYLAEPPLLILPWYMTVMVNSV
jgi:hypothetical protein